MYREESDAMRTCADCGSTVDPGRGRAYGGDEGVLLCSQCAQGRGGAYDELRDSWVRAPDVADLIDRHG